MYQQKITVADRLASFAASVIREKADKPEMDRRRAAYLASQTFPNDRFVRRPRREEKPVVTQTPRERFARLQAAYVAGPLPRQNYQKPRNARRDRKGIVGVLVHGIAHAFKGPRKTVVV
jgi:hypothetical protein